MRYILIVLGLSVVAAMVVGFLNIERHLWSDEMLFEDFEDNDARLAFLRTLGFLPAADCAPRVDALEFIEGQDHWATFVLSDGPDDCHGDPGAVLPAVSGEDDDWRECLHREEGQGRHRYTCFGR